MLGTQVLIDALTARLATDTGTLAAAQALKVHLIKAPFTPGPTTAFGTLTEAAFTGSAAKDAGTGAQQVFTDPVTGLKQIQLLEPAGGWTWICTATPSPAEQIYGVCVTNNDNSVTYGSALLAGGPITINAAGQAITLPTVRFALTTTTPLV